jgi:hemerythrin-like domain-containing protein
MLGAGLAWSIFHEEHARMRELMTAMDDVLTLPEWHSDGPRLRSLRELVLQLRTFDTTHRVKGVALLSALRGRSSEADKLLDQLAHDRRQCDYLLSRAQDLLNGQLAEADHAAAARIASAIQRHNTIARRHMDQEDRELRAYATQLLTPQEWAAVVSAVSSEVRAGSSPGTGSVR